MKENKNKVVFAGAGPGDPDLITVKSMKALKTADLIIYAGSLVPEAVLCWKGKDTETQSSAGMDLVQIIDAIKTYHAKGKKVVRLHTGDPSLYGAIFEQMRELEKIKIPYEVIPGVTAAFAAASKMNMEYTLPEVTQTLILTRISGRTPVPELESLEKLAYHQSSMAIYLSIGHAKKVQLILEKHYGRNAVCAVAYKVSHPEEKIVYTKIKKLMKTCEENSITRHALIIVGKSVEASIDNRAVVKSKLYDSTFSHGYRIAEK
ncbi:MAG: precorrin-4 C(11)-methyltransferase [Desulfobacula sp.]|jgi:precorrin-4/cobalt-precorrin-4 C11-methyltransferase|uniref:precorrin-4 C(11)-methyltransferase n=1 Tax=Desulfobacula sp. TaxID=2593537 RepID=UPI001D9D523A|nr:precorrin-4 C(11)-methyltransferase [Desulfobacula sp.]MBT3483927.1 precorrin-4 C(11)-methyltransferase [Desulfobacula sp.]MBT3803886.1 precorrin-4 C(11)-methyltransferase [Desulfobacula sp.]MBT4023831.1 precorrin-4 C(11)-methyltransferase [Desulfobacula sp.]MBT4197609.1 precorrin-4 C(11)-methyltransferase [Desulfobacula sp.]